MLETQGPVSGIGTGQVEGTPDAGTISDTPATTTGQAEKAEQISGTPEPSPEGKTQDKPATTTTEDTFFDPTSLPDELKPAYKQMQAAFTKKSQGIRQEKQKIDAYNAFERAPEETIQRIAQQMGYQLVRAGQQEQQAQATPQNTASDPNWKPDTWDEVIGLAEQRATAKILELLRPILGPLMQNMEQITSRNIETQLDSIDSNWRVYEDEIKENMKAHPTLIKSPDGLMKLYRISVPVELQTRQAEQRVVKKFEDKAKAATMGSKSTSHTAGTGSRKVNSFADAVQLAKDQLKTQGRY